MTERRMTERRIKARARDDDFLDGSDFTMRIAANRKQDEAFQDALRRAGVPEGVNTSSNSTPRRLSPPDRRDILKSGFDQ